MKESDARIAIAKTQNEIFKRIFNNITDSGFNPKIDLTGISTNSLRDYWTYTIGFLLVQNFENFGINLSPDDVEKIVQGHFKLKYISEKEASDFKQIAKKPPKKRGMKEITKLYSIQDGTYSIVTHKAEKNPTLRNQLILDTDSPKYFSDNPNLNMSSSDLIQILRNLFAHTAPYITGSDVVLLNKDDVISVPKMWLRGYSELFSQTPNYIDANFIIENLSKELKRTGNELETTQDIDNALSFLKKIIFQNMPADNFRINNFIKTRINLIENFKTLPLQEKVATIAHLLANNPNYIKSSAETINPTIIYNLQQLMSDELVDRNELLDMSMIDIDVNALQQLDSEIRQAKRNVDLYEAMHHPYRQQSEKVQINRLIKIYNSLVQERKSIVSEIARKTTLESSLMHLYETDGLKYIPAEIAVNTICLMGFNALVTSAYYDDLIFRSNAHNLTEKQQRYFSNISLSPFTYTHHGTKYKMPYDAYTNFYILKEIRNAICHGLITYQIPNSTSKEKVSFKDIEITFFVDYEDAEISGKLIDFYNLFSNEKIFFRKRPDYIVTGMQRELTDEGAPIFDDDDLPQGPN